MKQQLPSTVCVSMLGTIPLTGSYLTTPLSSTSLSAIMIFTVFCENQPFQKFTADPLYLLLLTIHTLLT